MTTLNTHVPTTELVWYNNIPVESREIAQISSLKEILTYCDSKKSMLLFDIDDTLIHHGAMLGSKKWREYIKQNSALHDQLSLYVARHYPTVCIERDTAALIRALQDQGHLLFGFTARERNCWYSTPQPAVDLLTKAQLQSAGIDFSKTVVDKRFTYLTENPAFFENTFFADTNTKKEFATKLFTNAPFKPEHVCFFDDREEHAKGVMQALNALGIPNTCYHFLQPEPFDPLIANIELYYLIINNEVISDERARELAKENPARDEAFYLREIIREAKLRFKS